MKFKKFLLYSLISFSLSTSNGFSKVSRAFFTEYYNIYLNNTNTFQSRNNNLPDIVNEDKIYNKKVFNFKGTLNITENGSLSFIDNATFILKDSSINNKGKKPIIFDKSTLTASKTIINSTILLKDSTLTYSNGYIKYLNIQGTSKIAIKDTKFDTLQFENLGATDAKIGAGFNNITAKNVKINISDINNTDDCKNKIKRIYNIKDVNIDHLDIKGYINIEPSKTHTSLDIPLYDFYNTKVTLNTTFNFDKGDIKKVTYIDPSVKQLIKLPRNEPGVFNFKNLEIDELKVSYNLLRNLGFNNVTVKYFELQDVNIQENTCKNLKDDNSESNEPEIPKYNNLQLIGAGISYFETFNLNNAKELKIESEINKAAYNAPLGSLYIKDLENYKDTQFSLYNIKEINFGLSRLPTPPMPEVTPPGGINHTININYLHRVTTLGIYNNTVKFNWELYKNPNTQKEQYISVYNLSNLKLQNSLLDVTKTYNIKSYRPNGTTYDPRKDYEIYDLNVTYESNMSGFGTIFSFDKSGAVQNGNQYYKQGRPEKNYVPLRIKVVGNSFTVANDMLSNLSMQLNGERNLFTLESNNYNKDYHFHTNYTYQYLDPKDGNQKPTSNNNKIKYNYWQTNESERVEQNWYTFKCDMVIVDKKSSDYKKYKKQMGDNKDYATTWFTYWQPYRVDKNGNPSKTPPKNSPGKDSSEDEYKYGDKKAWEQKTDGSGRGGFPCEFGNKIQVENSKVTMLKPLDNLTVLELVGKGIVDFYYMDPKYLEPSSSAGKDKKPQWITILRMRGGTLGLAQRPLIIDKLQIYTHGNYNYATLRPVFGKNMVGQKASNVLDSQKLIVNKLADFNQNYLKVDLYFNDYFIDLNHKVILNILDLGEYKEKVKDKDKDKDKEVIKKGEIKNLEGIIFDQGILFNTNHYWKDNKLYVEITRTKKFGDFINNIDKVLVKGLDEILDKYTLKVDKEGKYQYLEDGNLNADTKMLINSLFKAKSAQLLEDYVASLRPINNEILFLTTTLSSEKLLESVKNSNNYTYESNRGKLTLWSTSSIGNSSISNKGNLLGTTLNTQTLVTGTSSKIDKFKLGIFVGYAHNKFTSAYNKGEASQYGGGIYTDITLGKGYFLKMSSISTNVQFKGNREHYFMDSNTNFKFNGTNTVGNLNLGKTFITKGGFITSYISTSIGYLKLNNYKEDGTSPATLDVKGVEFSHYLGNIGIEYAKQIDMSLIDYDATIVPKIGIAYKYRWYNIPDTQVQFDKINSKNLIIYPSNNYNKYSIVVNTGINFLINYHFSATSNFNAELINKDLANYNFYIGCKYSF